MSDNNFKIDHDEDGVSGFRWIDDGHYHDGKNPHVHELDKDDLSEMKWGDLDHLNDFRKEAEVRDLNDTEKKEYSRNK